MILRLALRSIWGRRLTSILTILSISLSVALLIGVERIRLGAKDSFAGTISQTDLIVGGRTGPVQLLLYTVFHMGNATNNLGYDTFLHFKNHPSVAWAIPISLGDSHRGFRVVATDDGFFRHYRFQRDRRPEFRSGHVPRQVFDVALGAEVAVSLGYEIGDEIALAHGIADDGEAFQKHDDKPFAVVGILETTGTPIDRSLYITLEGVEAIHMDWQDGGPPSPENALSPGDILAQNITIEEVTAFFLRMKTRIDTLRVQREVNEYETEPLLGIIPGVALSDLWEGISYAENGLRIVSSFVVIVGLLGMLISLYNSLNERRREMAILRSLGAGPPVVFALLIMESAVLTVLGIALGVLSMYGGFLLLQPAIENHFGLYIPVELLTTVEIYYLGAIMGFGLGMGLIPAYQGYRNTLSDGLTIRV